LRPPGIDTIRRDPRDEGVHRRDRTIFTFLRAWAIGHHAAAADALDSPPPAKRTPHVDAGAAGRLEDYLADHERVRLDPEARNVRHTHVDPSDDRTWRVLQVLIDPAEHNDWMAELEVDLAASRAANQPVLWLRSIGPIG
jgi:hypothetical protein